MDDTKDKIRRNLVVFSAAIIFGWFLDIKLATVTRLFVPASGMENVSAGKLWLVACFILIYLSLRYKFDDATNSQIASLFEEFQAQRRKYLSIYLQRKADHFCHSGKPLQVFGASLSNSVNQQIERFEREYSQSISLVRLGVYIPKDEENKPRLYNHVNSIWTGRVAVTEEYLKPGIPSSHITSEGLVHDFRSHYLVAFGIIFISIFMLSPTQELRLN